MNMNVRFYFAADLHTCRSAVGPKNSNSGKMLTNRQKLITNNHEYDYDYVDHAHGALAHINQSYYLAHGALAHWSTAHGPKGHWPSAYVRAEGPRAEVQGSWHIGQRHMDPRDMGPVHTSRAMP